jgi:pilus assembly protein Flp/PilA
LKQTLLNEIRSLYGDESGQDLIEYAIIALLIVLGAIAAMGNLATNINSALSKMGSALTNDVS